jgi:hypothetical protein
MQSRTLEGPTRPLLHYAIPFTNRAEFESVWPHILKVKSKGAPIVLRLGPSFWLEGSQSFFCVTLKNCLTSSPKAMKFTIRALIVLTLLVALSAHAFLQWRRTVRVRAEIVKIETEIKRLQFDKEYVDSQTKVCELAIANNRLPSPYFLAAKRRHEDTRQ